MADFALSCHAISGECKSELAKRAPTARVVFPPTDDESNLMFQSYAAQYQLTFNFHSNFTNVVKRSTVALRVTRSIPARKKYLYNLPTFSVRVWPFVHVSLNVRINDTGIILGV